ncbi:low affinity iron permease family protein [Roseiarcaceae bacterium H3SJ34-1]|uniref:low affinity iron permease family protein n=1 Tax=Terripilifer ovatus TaxID=3032367 RepID=UPI003AB93B90|nr:low affinity iron permease family protein [Roseiarcaceae bacterium H3SJ34-1]
MLARWLTHAGTLAARPSAFAGVGLYTLLWIYFDPASLDWHGATTLVTLCIALFIQRSEHRDTQALHAKLDELLRVNGDAATDMAKIDEKEPEEIEESRHGG